jgi:branched-chain amino acid transport system substrate-binding protein
MKTLTAILILFIVTAFVLAGCITGNVVKEEKQTVKIGLILPLTGQLSNLGESARYAALIAESQLNNTKYNYKIIFEDNELDPKLTSTALQKLINIDKVDAVISFTSGPGNVVSPVAQENKIIHIGIGSDKNIAKGEYNFLHWTQPEEENRVFVAELQKLGIKNIAVFSWNQQGSIAVLDDLKEKLKETDIKIVGEDISTSGEKDFKTNIMKMEKLNPDAYVMLTFPPELDIAVKQMKELDVKAPVIGIETIESTEHPELFEGSWFVNAADATETFARLFKEKYPDKTVQMASGNVYDAINLIATAYENAGKSADKPTTEEAASALSEIKNFNGALGTLNVGEDGIVQSIAAVKMVKDGKFVTTG